jgi:hypothetical protein
MPDEPSTLTDDEIRTAVVGDVHSRAGTPGPADDGDDTGDDTGDPTDTTDTGDDSGDDSGDDA